MFVHDCEDLSTSLSSLMVMDGTMVVFDVNG